MRGTMMDFPLTLPTLLERATSFFLASKSSLAAPDRSLLRTCYRQFLSPGAPARFGSSRNSVYAPAIVSPP